MTTICHLSVNCFNKKNILFAFYCIPNFYTADSLIDQNNKIK